MDWKKFIKKALFPHPLWVAALSIAAAVLLAYSFCALQETEPLRIASYVLSFYALVLVCVRVPDIVRWIRHEQRSNRYYVRYHTDVQLRINIALHGTFAFNASYALFQLCLGFWHHSVWFYAMAAYHLLLAVMRLTLVCHTRRYTPGENTALEWRKYRLCGVCMLVMNLALAVFALYFIFRIRIFRHHEITTIAMAAYTFSALTIAIVNAVRSRKFGSPAFSAAKAISLASATVSMLTLENAMLTTFGHESSEVFCQIILGSSSIAVICIVQGIALYMIINANRALKANVSPNKVDSYHQKRLFAHGKQPE